ncbi:DUF4124 domain-containing protein [Uliginosibacterium paludis]|uniref:DUF4124 domain-containing protein n=1 Tax=Uliginosibacterium paludis TaxID=1615952 RepID=A0ABV2CUA3_9RHOO
MKARKLAVLAALALPLMANAEIYTWKDANGRTHFGDQPPPNAQVKTMRGGAPVESTAPEASGSAPSAQASGPKSWQEQNKDFAKRQTEKAEAEAKANKEREAKAQKDEYCSNLRSNIALLERGGRISKANDKGEAIPMSDNQLQAELDRARAALSKDCK